MGQLRHLLLDERRSGMTEEAQQAAIWKDPSFVQGWMDSDRLSDLLAFPRRLAAALVANDRPDPRLVVDIGSGPGAFLAAFLDEFANIRGLWSDSSEAMEAHARERLAQYGERVEFLPGDMTDLERIGLPTEIDVIVTSRAAHHLDGDGLLAFYSTAASHLAPGGWLVNLDHTAPADVWDTRFRAVRPRFSGRRAAESTHHHNRRLASVQDHLDGYAAAGITDAEIAWKAFAICLFIGRLPG